MLNGKIMKMILDIDPIKSGVTSVLSAFTGSFLNYISLSDANTAFQHLAWTVAIIAGIVSIINGVIAICNKFKETFKKK